MFWFVMVWRVIVAQNLPVAQAVFEAARKERFFYILRRPLHLKSDSACLR